MYYHTITITLQNTSPTTTPHPPSPSPTPHPKLNPNPTPTSLSSARNIADLICTHRDAWGLERMPASNIQWITDALFTLLPRLDEPSNNEAFVGLCVAAKAFTRRWEATRPTLDAVQSAAREIGVVLPVETDLLFKNLDKLVRVGGVSDAAERRMSGETSSETTNLS